MDLPQTTKEIREFSNFSMPGLERSFTDSNVLAYSYDGKVSNEILSKIFNDGINCLNSDLNRHTRDKSPQSTYALTITFEFNTDDSPKLTMNADSASVLFRVISHPNISRVVIVHPSGELCVQNDRIAYTIDSFKGRKFLISKSGNLLQER